MISQGRYTILKVPNELYKSFFEMDKKEAKNYFEWFLSVKVKRLAILCEYVQEESDIVWSCDYSRESLTGLFECFKNVVKYRTITKEEKQIGISKLQDKYKGIVPIPEKVIDEETVSFCFDTGLYFGETIKKNIEGLEWSNRTSSTNYAYYAQPILIKKGKKVDLNPRAIMEVLAGKVLRGTAEYDGLLKLYDTWISLFK